MLPPLIQNLFYLDPPTLLHHHHHPLLTIPISVIIPQPFLSSFNKARLPRAEAQISANLRMGRERLCG